MTSCTVCPFGTLALPGMAVCVANDDVALTRTTAFSALQVLHNYDPTAKNALFSSNTQKMVSVPIFMLAILPLVIVIASTMPTKARNLPPGFVNFFRGIDLYAMRHALQEHQSPTLRRTLLGGAFSIVALGTILSIAASLVVQYATNNTLTQRSVLPAMLPTLEELAVLPAFTSSDATDSTSVPPLLDAIAPSFDTLMQVNIHAMGPLCRNISVMQTGILTGVFTLGSVVDNSTLAVQHTLKCDGCALGPLSALNMSLDASCQSLRVEAIASGATGSVTVVAFSASSDGNVPDGSDVTLSSVDAVLVPSLETFEDVTAAVKRRGYLLAPSSVLVQSSLRPAAVTLSITLNIAPTYVMQRVAPILSLTQLASNIVGLSGLLGAFGLMFMATERRLIMCNRMPNERPLDIQRRVKTVKASPFTSPDVAANPMGESSHSIALQLDDEVMDGQMDGQTSRRMAGTHDSGGRNSFAPISRRFTNLLGARTQGGMSKASVFV
jgi:hypothetical protein